jgi:putative oxidoreductase
MEKNAELVGRIMLASIFVIAGIGKLGDGYAGTQAYMAAMGVPAALLPAVILLEIGGGLALIIGWQTRWVAVALAGFSLIAAVIFHREFADQMQMIMFLKNIAISGGLLILASHGAAGLSVDRYLGGRSGHTHRVTG